MGTGEEATDEDADPGNLADIEGDPGGGVSLPMMEQWLEQTEGDPTYLLRNQFLIEEQLELRRRGPRMVEPRPW